MTLEQNFEMEVLHLRKEYPGTVALDNVTLGFRGGEVHAIIGKNGAGKSTLVRMLAGASQPTSGTILLRGEPIRLRSPREALRHGIAMVHQELSLVHGMTVAENILLGRWPTRMRGIRVDRRAVINGAEHVLHDMRVSLDVTSLVGSLPVGTQQVVEIAKAVACNPKVLILDEPTSALSREEANHLATLIRRLAKNGLAIIYISHRLQELRDVADSVSVLRDARLAGSIPICEAAPGVVAKMMFGDVITHGSRPPFTGQRKALLAVRGLGSRKRFNDVSFILHAGETLGIAGMVGSGRTELLRAIGGADSHDEGLIEHEGEIVSAPAAGRHAARTRRSGIALIPEDRKRQGLALSLSTMDNICMASWKNLARWGSVSMTTRRRVTQEAKEALGITMMSPESPVARLSGGNQQKVVVAKWLLTKPSVLLFDEPTRGIDIQAKQQIFELIARLNSEGVGALFVSSELEELFEVCHRILIMRNGRITGEVLPSEVTVHDLFQLSLGMEEMPVMKLVDE